MGPERFDFPNAAGELLAARLERPSQPAIAYALFAHCFTCGKDSLAAKRISEALTARGIAVLRFDFTGLVSPTSSRRRTICEKPGARPPC